MEQFKITPPAGLRINGKGIIIIENIYTVIKDFFSSHDYLFQEKKHITRHKDKGEKTKIVLEAIKDVTDFIQFFINIEIKVNELQLSNEGKFQIFFHAALNLDYLNKYGDHQKIIKFIFENYKKRVKKIEIKHYEDKLGEELTELISEVKQELGLIN